MVAARTEEDRQSLVVESACEKTPEIDSKTLFNETTREKVVRAREEGTTIHREEVTRATAVLLRSDSARSNNHPVHLSTISKEVAACRPVLLRDPNVLATIRENPEEADRRAEMGVDRRRRNVPDETKITTPRSIKTDNKVVVVDSSKVFEEEEEEEEEVEEEEVARRRLQPPKEAAKEVVVASEID